MYAGKPTSWIRDHALLGIESSFGAGYRDTVILNPLNGKIETVNLTTYNLTVPANREMLKSKLIAAATPADTDNDRIPDYWEEWAYGNLSHTGSTPGGGGLDTLLHYGHCCPAPAAGLIPGAPELRFVTTGEGIALSLRWTRRRGTAFGMTFTPEFSNDLNTWTVNNPGYEDYSSRILYDGSGGELIEWRSTVPNPLRFARVKVRLY